MLNDSDFSIVLPACLKITRLANQILDDAERNETASAVKNHISQRLKEIEKEVAGIRHDLKLPDPIV